MNKDLIGYLLHTLDPATHQQVEAELQSNPEARRQLERARQALEPLELLRDDAEPPPGLVIDTLARVAEHRARPLPQAPRERARVAGNASWWRRPDALVAALILVAVGMLVIPSLLRVWHQQQVAACANNLRQFHQALVLYSDQQPGQAFPRVEMEGPRGVAGVFVPILHDAGVLPQELKFACPGQA